jgi:lipoate-protein ligase A
VRYLNLGTVDYRTSQAVYHAVAASARPHDPVTLITASPDRAYVSVGYHQVASREIDRAYCEALGIPVSRRMVGGGAVYLDHDQIFWHLVLPGVTIPVESLYARLLPAAVVAYRRMGIPARLRPVNDLLVGGRKIGGTGAATIGSAMVLVGSIMMDFDSSAMARVLKVPSEKFRDKLEVSLADYMTSIRRELGRHGPSRELATAQFVAAFAERLGEPVLSSELRPDEARRLSTFAERLFDPAFVYRDEGRLEAGVKVREGVRLLEGVHKAAGGLIRLIYRVREGVFDDVLLSGDFFVEPVDGLERFARMLVGRPAEVAQVGAAAEALLREVRVPGVTAADLVAAFRQSGEPMP